MELSTATPEVTRNAIFVRVATLAACVGCGCGGTATPPKKAYCRVMRRGWGDGWEDGVCWGWGRRCSVCWEELVVGCLGGILLGVFGGFLLGDRCLGGEGGMRVSGDVGGSVLVALVWWWWHGGGKGT